MNITAEPVQLGDDNSAPAASRLDERGGQLWASVERISALARFDLNELPGDLKASAAANRETASRWASRPRPERPWRAVETR
jgi:hypothetical protein